MREQVANRRTGRAGGLVEVDDSLLGGDERRERGDGLRDRGESNRPRCVAVRRDLPVGIDDTGGRELDRPAVDLAERLHARRY